MIIIAGRKNDLPRLFKTAIPTKPKQPAFDVVTDYAREAGDVSLVPFSEFSE